jgi:hypothetical protein
MPSQMAACPHHHNALLAALPAPSPLDLFLDLEGTDRLNMVGSSIFLVTPGAMQGAA